MQNSWVLEAPLLSTILGRDKNHSTIKQAGTPVMWISKGLSCFCWSKPGCTHEGDTTISGPHAGLVVCTARQWGLTQRILGADRSERELENKKRRSIVMHKQWRTGQRKHRKQETEVFRCHRWHDNDASFLHLFLHIITNHSVYYTGGPVLVLGSSKWSGSPFRASMLRTTAVH